VAAEPEAVNPMAVTPGSRTRSTATHRPQRPTSPERRADEPGRRRSTSPNHLPAALRPARWSRWYRRPADQSPKRCDSFVTAQPLARSLAPGTMRFPRWQRPYPRWCVLISSLLLPTHRCKSGDL
jgi:hypothetical protein